MLKINEYKLGIDRLRKEITVVNVPDIHYKKGYNIRLLKALFDEIHRINPHVLCIPGDLVDQLSEIDNNDILILYDKLKEFKKDIIISLDWHDYMNRKEKMETIGNYKALIDDLSAIKNVHVFPNAFINSNNLVYDINGVNFTAMSREPELCHGFNYENDHILHEIKLRTFYKYLNSYDISLPMVLCYHDPDIFHKNPRYTKLGKRNSLKTALSLGIPGVNLVLSGHKHGSLTPKIIGETLARGFVNVDNGIHLGGRYLGGLYKSEDMAQVVSRGLIKFPSTNEFFLPINTLNKIYDNSFDVIRLVRK